ncbi:MAG: c-type cytochrome biogenesis protein CcmI [Gammaproteobacteria bacterium]|nr:c-type cytochrome biogenesis protein CcmI [Gammaproteobacteria bacterium]
MMVFWIVALLLMVAALLFLLPPLLQRDIETDVLEREQINVLLYEDQLVELQSDLDSGAITADQFDQAHADLERALIGDVSKKEVETGSVGNASSSRASGAAIVVGLAVPIMAVSLYLKLGEEQGLEPDKFQAGAMTTQGHEGTLEEQVRRVQDHLQENPDDLEAWAMLARSYYFLKQYQGSSDAFARVVSMTGEQNPELPNLLTDYADALAMASGRNMAGKPYELVKKAMEIQPFHQKALWLAATATYQSKDYQATLEYWEKLIQTFPEGSEDYIQVQRNIAEVKGFLGMPGSTDVASVSTTQAQSDGEEGSLKVSGVVSLDASLQTKVSPSDTVFIFARAANGPRMPLAIIRKQVSDLPLTFSLDDSLAMNPAMKLSKFQEVIVGARISKSGNAMPQSGDLAGASDVIKVGSGGLIINIDGVVP